MKAIVNMLKKLLSIFKTKKKAAETETPETKK